MTRLEELCEEQRKPVERKESAFTRKARTSAMMNFWKKSSKTKTVPMIVWKNSGTICQKT